MQTVTNKPFTLLVLEGNSFTHLDTFLSNEEAARGEAKLLTQTMRDRARAEARKATSLVVAVRTLDSINRNTRSEDLTVTDLRWLAGETVDRCDFFIAAPDWARKAVDSVADRRNFTPQYVKHVLAAIRCILSVDRQMCRQVEAHEAAKSNKF